MWRSVYDAQRAVRPSKYTPGLVTVEVGDRLLNAGIYDGAEVARLIRRDASTVASWTRPARSTRARPPLLEPQHAGGLFSFLDLVSLYVISELLRRRVARDAIYRGGISLSQQLGTARPFAHKRLATAGRAFFADVDEWVDVGKWGQRVLDFESMVKPVLRPITYRADFAATWQPHTSVLIDPRRQAGAPCIEGTRVPTAIILRYLASGENERDIADDLALRLDQVRAAQEFEQSLDRAA
jgi:uncharacterized protein (DUF433 family)